MLHPSYVEMINAVNAQAENEDRPLVSSRYSIVMATAKRARQIVAGDEPMEGFPGDKPLSIAVEEIYQGDVQILPGDEQ